MTRIVEIFWFFLKAGAYSFGEPEHHISLMHNELVTKKHILDEETFARYKKESASLPGYGSIQLAMKIGLNRRGVLGMLVAGLAFIIPSVLLMLVFALYYREFVNGKFKLVDSFFYGIRAAVVSILLYTTLVYGIRYIKDVKLFIIFIIVTIASILGLNAVLLLLLGGFTYVLLRNTNAAKKAATFFILQVQPQFVLPLADNQKLLGLFLKIGAFMIGSIYFFVAWVKTDLVDAGLLPLNTLLDSVALGLFVPGPIFSVSVFIGYILSSWNGAMLALLGVMTPIFLFALIGNKILPKFLSTLMWRSFYRGVTVGSIGIIMGVILMIGYQSLLDIRQWIIFIVCFLIMLKWSRLNLLWIIIIATNLGYIILHFFPIPLK
jgi:chromate transporter